MTAAGSTTVATDGMRAAIAQAAALTSRLRHGLAAIHRAELVPHAPPLGAVEQALRAAISTAERLHDGLTRAVERYSAASRDANGLFDALAGVGGALLGTQLRMGALFGGPALVLGALAGIAGGEALTGRKLDPAALARFLEQHPQLTGNPTFVAAVRGVADGMDEGMLTAAGVPPVIAVALGATGRTGMATSADALMAIGPRLGLLEESPVDVQRVDRQRVDTAPSGATQRLERVPEGDQVRIERYTAPGSPDRFVVYVGPTETFDPRPEGEPWDMASNVGGVGGEDVASIRATELAMRDAGITDASQVQLVGFSQGGMVAARIAADGDWNAVGLQTFGAPSGNVVLPDGVQGMAVRNREDFIPALAGPQTDHHLLQVERTVYADPSTMPTDQAAPGHQRVAYAATAQAIDAARSEDVRAQSRALDDFAGDYARRPGSTITASLYHAVRRDGSGG
ncbi:hypothetical protein [Pseudolysinimonas kribbensis]|uniref:hypothetical protein n=1 Tax=Pseudolysinimonas kribbensis TaxID=433641 RepID=UPI0024E0D8A4|nr:hypothetical protein [Pseudolysinimonas kribbensis]